MAVIDNLLDPLPNPIYHRFPDTWETVSDCILRDTLVNVQRLRDDTISVCLLITKLNEFVYRKKTSKWYLAVTTI